MSIVVAGALIGLFLIVTALGGSKLSRQALLRIVVLMAALLLAIWYFLPA